MKNYYQILNISPTATDVEIKRSYRVLAKRYHPDVNPGDAAAADKFADINEANSVLSDPKARAEYDAKLKESSSSRLSQEDIIARQRAQAQSAARQAARQAQYRNMGANSDGRAARDAATIARMRQAAAQAQAAARASAARQSQFQSAQAAASQVQAQMQAIRNQAFQSGREQGAAEVKEISDMEISKLNATIRTLTAENKRLKAKRDEAESLRQKLADAERDRRELEQELFNRDRELTQEKIHAKDMEEQLGAMRNDTAEKITEAETIAAENASLKDLLDKAQLAVSKLEQEKKKLDQERKKSEAARLKIEQEKKKLELNSQAQIQLQLEKRRQLQSEVDDLKKQIEELNSDLTEVKTENEQWEQYAKSEEFISDTERRIDEWTKKTQADRRLAKPTLYGALGVLIWATDDEIEKAYAKLSKRYSGKTDPAIVAKLNKATEAYETLSDGQKRIEYNKSIDISNERILEERRLIAENESLMEEYRSRLASKEFWAHFDDLVASGLAGDVTSQNALGELYYYGDEVEQDFEQAVYWFKEAAKQKNADAMYSLGICFVNGEGVERNESTGKGFIRQAAKLGSKAAKQYLSGVKKTTSGTGASDGE